MDTVTKAPEAIEKDGVEYIRFDKFISHFQQKTRTRANENVIFSIDGLYCETRGYMGEHPLIVWSAQKEDNKLDALFYYIIEHLTKDHLCLVIQYNFPPPIGILMEKENFSLSLHMHPKLLFLMGWVLMEFDLRYIQLLINTPEYCLSGVVLNYLLTNISTSALAKNKRIEVSLLSLKQNITLVQWGVMLKWGPHEELRVLATFYKCKPDYYSMAAYILDK